MSQFQVAPWCTLLKVFSLLCTLVLLGVGLGLYLAIPPVARLPWVGSVGLFVLVAGIVTALAATLFVVRGYEIDGSDLRVQRLLWTTSLSLGNLRSVWQDSAAMKGSLRLFGNGGLFSITGLYWSKSLRRYRAFVTDPAKAVVLELEDRVLVVSPADPAAFVEQLRHRFPRAREGPDRKSG